MPAAITIPLIFIYPSPPISFIAQLVVNYYKTSAHIAEALATMYKYIYTYYTSKLLTFSSVISELSDLVVRNATNNNEAIFPKNKFITAAITPRITYLKEFSFFLK
jgi:hypothetical protein